MKSLLTQRNIVIVYFFYLILGHVFILSVHLNEFPYKYVFSDWLINYEGGFIRRGLFGQIAFEIFLLFNFEIKNTIFFFQVFGYVTYFVLVLNLLKKIKLNFFWILIIFSTITFLYPLAELEALGRKDIYVILCFLVFTLLDFNSLNKIITAFLIIFTFSSLIHEISFFYLPYYFLIIFFRSYFKLKKKINIKHILIILTYISILAFLHLFISGNAKIDDIVKSYNVFSYNLSENYGAFSWLLKPLNEHLSNIYESISLKYIIRYLYLILINVWIIVHFIRLKEKIIFFLKEIKISHIFCILVVLSFPIYIFALDWGRVTYITFNFMFIIIIFFQKDKLIDLNYLEKKIKPLSLKIKTIIFFFICILYGPKILMTDDLSGFPLYKTFDKIQDTLSNNLSLFQ